MTDVRIVKQIIFINYDLLNFNPHCDSLAGVKLAYNDRPN